MNWPRKRLSVEGYAWTRAAVIPALILAFFLPALVASYHLLECTLLLIYAIAILGLDILTGYCGQVSIGHSAFFGVGAYVCAILMATYGWPYWLAVPAAIGVCFIVGFLFGFPALRLEGMYLALATFSLAVAFPELPKFNGVQAWTGGVQGIALLGPEAPFGAPISSDSWIYLLVLLAACACFLLARNLVRSRIGLALIAIRDNPTAAATLGVNVSFYKTVTFGLSAAYAGLAGALQGLAIQFVAPDSYTFFLSVSFMVGMVIGGMGTIYGALIGAAFVEFAPNIASQLSKAAPGAVYGVLLIAMIYLSPRGVVPLMRRLRALAHGSP